MNLTASQQKAWIRTNLKPNINLPVLRMAFRPTETRAGAAQGAANFRNRAPRKQHARPVSQSAAGISPPRPGRPLPRADPPQGEVRHRRKGRSTEHTLPSDTQGRGPGLTVKVGHPRPSRAKDRKVTHSSPGACRARTLASPRAGRAARVRVCGRQRGRVAAHETAPRDATSSRRPPRSPPRTAAAAEPAAQLLGDGGCARPVGLGAGSQPRARPRPPAPALPPHFLPSLLHPSPQGQGLPGPQT